MPKRSPIPAPGRCIWLLTVVAACSAPAPTPPPARAGNPVFAGFYADPEAAVFGERYWVYPTYSAPYDEQTFFDAFSSPDLVHWTKHPRVLERDAIAWARRAMWAPAIVAHEGRWFLFFSANDIQSDAELGGIGVAVADRPEGPFRDHLGKPLIDRFHHGAQPIDQFAFRDSDGQWYLIYGGWRHCNIARLRSDFGAIEPFADGQAFREITPQGYVEGPFLFVRGGRYYFMWSEGGWTGPDYSVAYAIGDSPLGPFQRIGKVLQQDPRVATGAGHHSVLQVPGTDEWYIVYHRRPLDRTDRNHRVVCIDRMRFAADGRIEPVQITFDGVAARPLGAQALTDGPPPRATRSPRARRSVPPAQRPPRRQPHAGVPGCALHPPRQGQYRTRPDDSATWTQEDARDVPRER